MASRPQTRGREDERRLSIRTLVIASIASLTAAIVTSHFWTAGTPIAAAVTPVLVSLVSELLHRPTERIAERLTTDAPLVRARGPATRRGAEPGTEVPAVPTHRTPVEPPPVEAGPVPVNVYKQPAPRRRRLAIGAAVATGVLAFAVAALVLTVPELIAGQSIGKSDRKSTYFGGHHRQKSDDQQPEQQTTPTQTQTQTTETTPQDKKKESTTPSQDKQKTTTQKTTPSTQPQSQPGK